MSKRRILLLAPSFMDLYIDIVKGLNDKGYNVVWVEDDQIPGNPIKKLDRNNKTPELYDIEISSFWQDFFDKSSNDLFYDYFIAIGGLMSHEFKKLVYFINSIHPIK